MGAHGGTGLPDTRPTGSTSRFGGEIAQEGSKADAARTGLRFQLLTHVIVDPDGHWDAHIAPAV